MEHRLLSPDIQRLHDEDAKSARPVSQQARDLAAEHLRRDNSRRGRVVWDDLTTGEIVNGKRDGAPVVQAIADTLSILGIEP